jgi:hypothetical protein
LNFQASIFARLDNQALMLSAWVFEKPSKVDAGINIVPGKGTCHSQQSTLGKNETVAAAYLRAAHAYMLISMPTGTSTIFGDFQAILALLAKPDELRPGS